MFYYDLSRCGALHNSGFLCDNTDSGIDCCLDFHSCSYDRSLCREERHRLTLHVGSHQRTVRVVVLKERNEVCSHREYHLRRHIHIIKFISLVLLRLLAVTTGYVLVNEVAFLIKRRIRLSHMIVVFLIGGHVNNFIRNTRVHRIGLVDLPVRRLDKAVFIDPCIGCKGVDQTDVRTLRGLDRTHSSIV